jgi:hypothetical protein
VTTELRIADLGTVAIYLVGAHGSVGHVTTALQARVALVGGARDRVVALRVVGAGAAQRGVARVGAYVQAAVVVGRTCGTGFTTCIYMERTPHRAIAAPG